MSVMHDVERAEWTSILEQEFAPADCGLHLGDMHETEWHTILAEFLDAQNNVFMIAEIDEETKAVVRCRRPSGPMVRRH